MNRREFLKSLALGALAAALPGAAFGGAKSAPNVVFFLVDDLGWTDVGCYGSSFYDTPNIDALAQDGVRFTDAYAACHVCSPTRASILTGKYPARQAPSDRLAARSQGVWIPETEERGDSSISAA
ncbi:MAG: sulfatase-like hydrolase/transferase [Planctomycetota bacterium]